MNSYQFIYDFMVNLDFHINVVSNRIPPLRLKALADQHAPLESFVLKSFKPQVLAGEHEEALHVLGEAQPMCTAVESEPISPRDRPPCAFGSAMSRLL